MVLDPHIKCLGVTFVVNWHYIYKNWCDMQPLSPSVLDIIINHLQWSNNCKTVFIPITKVVTPPSSSLQQCEIACTPLFVQSALFHLPKHRWTGLTVTLGPSGTCACKWGSTVHRYTTHLKHVPLKEGGQFLQSTDHLFQTALCSPTPDSWQQLAARRGHSSPACQSVHYCEAWE